MYMISISDRVDYYMGNVSRNEKPELSHNGYDVPIELNLELYKENYRIIHPNTAYPMDVVRYLKCAAGRKLIIQCGDSPYTSPARWPVLVKTRDTRYSSNNHGVIANLNSMRHWGDVFKHTDIPWNSKLNEFVWRGADTGGDGHRLRFVTKYGPSHNVGFSGFVQDALESPYLYSTQMIKKVIPVDEMLKYKYLPVIDGNDKSSSLGWVMASNSVPLMPEPRFHSWVCEPWLKAGEHYVVLKDDYSDFEEKLQWCRDNDDKCKEIATNGKEFMLQFTNPLRESYLEEKLIDRVICL